MSTGKGFGSRAEPSVVARSFVADRDYKAGEKISFGSEAEPRVVATAATTPSFTEYEWDNIVSALYMRCNEFCIPSDNCDCGELVARIQAVRKTVQGGHE